MIIPLFLIILSVGSTAGDAFPDPGVVYSGYSFASDNLPGYSSPGYSLPGYGVVSGGVNTNAGIAPADTTNADPSPANTTDANLSPADTTETEEMPADTSDAGDPRAEPDRTGDVPADTNDVEDPTVDPDEVESPTTDPGRDEEMPADTNDVEDPLIDTNDVDDPPRDRPMTPEELRDQRGPPPDEPEVMEPVEPLTMAHPSAYHMVSNDSLNRWELWSDYGESLTRRPGVISFQLGGLGRNDGFLLRAHENRHQRVLRDGIPLNERIFGSANRKRLPHYSRMASVHEFSGHIRHQSEITTQRYHVTRPLTLINYDQSEFEYRSTEGYLARNITPSTNLSIGYWGKNESEGYRNSGMGGRNAEITAYHFLTDSWMFEGGLHYSGLQFGEPDGYLIGDMNTFHFNHFQATPVESQAESSLRNTMIRLTAYHRPDPETDANTRISVYHDRYRRLHYQTPDSSIVRTLTTGVAGRHIQYYGPFELQGDLHSEWSVIDRDRYRTMDVDSWIYSEGKGMVTLPLPNRSQLHTWFKAGWRSDGFTDYEMGSKVNWRIFSRLTAYASYARGEQMPLPGQLYWQRAPVYGQSEFRNEILQRAEAGVTFQSRGWELGGEVHGSVYEQPVLVGQDSTFIQAGSYNSAGTAGWMFYDGDRFELAVSGTFQQYFSDALHPENQLLDLSGQRVWTRASFHYKNYVFDSAAFIKAGFYALASPNPYRSAQYYPAMDYWDPNSWFPGEGAEAQAIPDFVRLDLDLTARVRSAIFLFRIENALDNWLFPGYFETAYHPMPSMRLRFGVRWVLRN